MISVTTISKTLRRPELTQVMLSAQNDSAPNLSSAKTKSPHEMGRLDQLPDELILHIIRLTLPSSTTITFFHRRSTLLRSFSLVSPKFRVVAQQELLRYPSFPESWRNKSNRLEVLIQCLEKHQLAGIVKELRVGFGVDVGLEGERKEWKKWGLLWFGKLTLLSLRNSCCDLSSLGRMPSESHSRLAAQGRTDPEEAFADLKYLYLEEVYIEDVEKAIQLRELTHLSLVSTQGNLLSIFSATTLPRLISLAVHLPLSHSSTSYAFIQEFSSQLKALSLPISYLPEYRPSHNLQTKTLFEVDLNLVKPFPLCNHSNTYHIRLSSSNVEGICKTLSTGLTKLHKLRTVILPSEAQYWRENQKWTEELVEYCEENGVEVLFEEADKDEGRRETMLSNVFEERLKRLGEWRVKKEESD